jgi:biopolymer transport protein ExbB
MTGKPAMMNMTYTLTIILLLASAPVVRAQSPAPTQAAAGGKSFDHAVSAVQRQLEDSLAELNQLRQQVVNEKIPLSRKLKTLESKLIEVRLEQQQASRRLDSTTLDLSNLNAEIKSRREEATYLSNLLSEYIRNFESRLHIAELQRYRDLLEAARLAPENRDLSDQEVYQTQAALVVASLDRLHDALGGTRFEGTAVEPNGMVKSGTFVLAGPAALFRSDDGQHIGTAETTPWLA